MLVENQPSPDFCLLSKLAHIDMGAFFQNDTISTFRQKTNSSAIY